MAKPENFLENNFLLLIDNNKKIIFGTTLGPFRPKVKIFLENNFLLLINNNQKIIFGVKPENFLIINIVLLKILTIIFLILIYFIKLTKNIIKCNFKLFFG